MLLSKQALYSEPVPGGIKCILCPHQCFIKEGKTGICKVRKNISGKLIAESWGKISAMHMDPIEKKPLYHFYPGRNILSIGSIGCNMRCQCCQNWQISQASPSNMILENIVTPEEVLRICSVEKNNLGVAFTYNEPSIGFEYVLETAQMIHENGYKNVIVSNGYINPEPLHELIPTIDAFNIDLKGFSDQFYRQFTGSSLDPVLQTLRQIRNSGRHLEITCLIVPSQNDDPALFRKMVDWISSGLGKETIFHLSRYHPAYKLSIESTPAGKMEELLEIAASELKYVYAGNITVQNYGNTNCSACGHTVIKRSGYYTEISGLMDHGLCRFCSYPIAVM